MIAGLVFSSDNDGMSLTSKFFATITTALILLFSTQALAQTVDLKNKNPFPTKYVNFSDEALVIKTVTLAPVYDNAGGIYKESIEKHLKELIIADHLWAYSDFSGAKKTTRVDEFDENPKLTLQVLEATHADGILTCFLIKGPQGITIQLNLYSRDQGKLLIREDFQDSKIFETNKINDVVAKMYENIKAKLPYSGFITSRKGNKITVNIGSNLGVKVGDTLVVAQVLKVNRHPKLNFMVGVEKEILGRINLTQVESDLSFGEISFEKETGVIDKGSKILPLDGVKYGSGNVAGTKDILPGDKNAIEWLPAPIPQFGKITLDAGLASFSDSAVLTTGKSIEAKSSLSLAFHLGAELWITPEYFAALDLQQINLKADNNLSGSSPDKLNYTINRANITFGYKYLIDGNFWGPQIYGSVGYLSHSVRVSDSAPTTYSSFDLTGFDLNAGGLFPVSVKNDVAVGGQVKFLLFKSVKESPVTSGDPKAEYSQFDLYGTYQYTTNLNLKAQVSLINIQMKYSGSGSKVPASRSLDEKITNFSFGVEYLF